MSRHIFIVLIFGIVILSIILRWNSFSAPFERDEGDYAYSAWLLRQNIPPYQNSFLQKPPMIIYTYFVGFLMNKEAVWPYRILALVFDIVTVFLVGAIVKKLKNITLAFAAMYLMVFMLSFYYFTYAANTERFMLAPLTGLLCLYVYFRNDKRRRIQFFAGCLGAAAVLYKPICLLVVMAIYVAWLLNIRAKSKKFSNLLPFCFSVLFGLVLTTGLTFSYFIFRTRPSYLINQLIFFNSFYAATYVGRIDFLLLHIFVIAINWFLMIAIITLGLAARFREKVFYVFLVAVALISIYPTNIGHYYLLLAPFLVILFSLCLESLSKTKVVKSKIEPNKFIIVGTLLVIITVLPVNLVFMSLTPNQLVKRVYWSESLFPEARVVSGVIKDRTKPSDYVFVFGSEPEVNFYSKRMSPDRFAYLNYVLWPTPFSKNYIEELVSSLNVNSPKIIVVVPNLSPVPQEFSDYMNEKLASEYALIGGYLGDETRGGWMFFDSQSRPKDARFLVYEKI